MKRMIVTFDLAMESEPAFDTLLQVLDDQGLQPTAERGDKVVILPLNTYVGEFEDDLSAEQLADRIRSELAKHNFAVVSLFAAGLTQDVAVIGEPTEAMAPEPLDS